MASAGSLGLRGSDGGSSSKSSEVALGFGTKDFDPKANRKTETFFDVALKLKSSTSLVTDANGNVSDDRTNEGSLDGGLSFTNGVKAGLGFQRSSESADQVTGQGGSGSLGYRYNFDPENEDFSPTLGFKVRLSANRIQQARTGKKSTTGLDLLQTSSRLDLDSDVWSWLSLSGSYEKFQYDKDVALILAKLDHQPLTTAAGSAFANDLSNLQSAAVSEGLSIHIGNFDLDLNNSVGRPISGGGDSIDQFLTGTYYGEVWSFAAGSGQSKTAGTDGVNKYYTGMIKFFF